MRKIYAAVFAALICIAVVFSGCTQKEKTGIDMTPQEFVESFNKAAKKSGFALKTAEVSDDGTLNIPTADDTVRVSGTVLDGKITSLAIEGLAPFEPTLPSYDYMVYAVTACDGTSFDDADKFIADLYYEAYFGGDEVLAASGGIQYAFEKRYEQCTLYIRDITED